MIDFVEFVASESERFRRAIAAIAAKGGGSGDNPGAALASVRVPSCPDWTAADLVWHLAEVQYFWAAIVEGNLATPGAVEPLERPADAELESLMAAQSENLVRQLSERGASEPCWSWHSSGGRVGWVRRRQAHEALIHRIDAELALASLAGGDTTGHRAIDSELAVDGVDEMLTVMLDVAGAPDWGRFEPDGTSVRLEVPGRVWAAELGLFVGTDPEASDDDPGSDGSSGAVELPALRLIDPEAAPDPSATVIGPASELDLWLWRRGDLNTASIDGDAAVIDRLGAMANLK